MIKSAKAYGIVPADLLVASAIEAGIKDLRDNPFLLDYCFSWLANDELTSRMYGEQEVLRAKQWFLNTKIWVGMASRTDDLKFPMISVNLQSSIEDYATLGDVNYETSEEVEAREVSVNPQIILGPFTPVSYDSATGYLTLPEGFTTADVFAGQIVVDITTNIGYTILEVISSTVLAVDAGLNANFVNAYIAPIDTFFVTSLESCQFKQTYSLKCFAQSQPIYVTYLHSILLFILLRYKESLLEGRGFDRSTVNSGAVYFANNSLFPVNSEHESTFGQDITLTGYVFQYWPKMISQKMQGVKIQGLKYIGGTATPVSKLDEVEEQGWWQETDPLPSDDDDEE